MVNLETSGSERGAMALSMAAEASTRRQRFLVAVAAGLSAMAGGIHATVMPEHAREAVLFGVFFAAAAVFQLGWAVLALLRPSRALLWVGAAGSAALTAVWIVSRTTGVPVGPHAWEAEPVGFVDLVVAFDQVAVVAAVVLVTTSARWLRLDAARVAAAMLGGLSVAALAAADSPARAADVHGAASGGAHGLHLFVVAGAALALLVGILVRRWLAGLRHRTTA